MPLDAQGTDSPLPEVECARLRGELHARQHEAEVNTQQMQRIFDYILRLQDVIPGAMFVVSGSGAVQRSNRAAMTLLGRSMDALLSAPLAAVLPSAPQVLQILATRPLGDILRRDAELLAADGERIPVMLSATVQAGSEGDPPTMVLIAMDMREQRRLEVELRHAQKLESLGQLAAGIAHEINTPMQFIGDNLRFVQDTVGDVLQLARQPGTATVDVAFLESRLPRALQRGLEGVQRVSRIVEALKTFAHPRTEAECVDLNDLIEKALVVATHAIKYVAEVERYFEPLPPVECGRGDISQVLLNLVTNAAHAIEDSLTPDRRRGRISLRTRLLPDGEAVEVQVEDDGPGIPEAIAHRIYDPFFTTKAVGRGTGQGLSICRSIVVDRHHGRLWHETLIPQGTRFRFTLPIKAHWESSHD